MSLLAGRVSARLLAAAGPTLAVIIAGMLLWQPGSSTPASAQGQAAVADTSVDVSPSALRKSRAVAVAWRNHQRAQRRPAPFKVRRAGPPLRLKPVPVLARPFTFQIGTLNVLGSQHTRGSLPYGPGVVRTARASGMVASRGVELMGFQEVQGDQLNVLYNQLGGYDVWPGRALGNNGVRLQIAYRADLFELVDTGSTSTRFDNMFRPIPYVLLRDRVSGGELWVVNIHNSPRTQELARDAATATEIALFNRLRATDRPVLVIGDMNEKGEWFCKVAMGAGMVAANGGSGSGGCYLPPPPLRIDWIMGSGAAFSDYVQDGASLAGITDHFFVRATVTVFPANLVLRQP